MWKPPKRRAKAKTSKRRLHLRRTAATIKLVPTLGTGDQASIGLNAKPIDGRVFLNEIHTDGIELFTTVALEVGKMVAISIEAPKQFFVKAKVKWCAESQLDPRVIAEQSFRFRSGLTFVFSSKEEEAAVEKYCAEIQAEYVMDEAA